MPVSVSDAVVVITGASSGIGRATAQEFARRGASVVLAARNKRALKEAAAECEQLGGRALAVTADVTLEEDVEDLARQAVDRLGAIDVWVNNAGVGLYARFRESPDEDFRRVLDCLKTGIEPRSALAQTIGSKGYHAEKFTDGPFPTV